jgi:hypothetical protein
MESRSVMSDSLQPKVRQLLGEVYRQNRTKPRSFFFDAVYEAIPELEELDPGKVRQMVSVAFAQNELDHASRTEEALRSRLARVRHEGNRAPEASGTAACIGGEAPCAGHSTAGPDHAGLGRAFVVVAEEIGRLPLKATKRP